MRQIINSCWLRQAWCVSVVLGVSAVGAAAQGLSADQTTRLEQLRTTGIAFLKSAQADDGSWTTQNAPGITGLVTLSLLRSGVSPADPAVAKGIKFLTDLVQPDGGIYSPKSNHKNYESCLAILVLQAANKGGQYDKLIAGADKYIRGQQWDEEELKEKGKDDPAYGGAGYGSKSRPDLSNTQFLIEALRAAGAGENDPALQKALVFVSRCQNLESEHNKTPFAAKVNDGGFYYTPAAGGSSMATEANTPNGGLRSYASMTYAGLKSMIYAGVGPDDPRVKAAVSWIRKFYTVSENPGAGQQGLYYYLNTFSKALHAVGEAEFTDEAGKKHDWRGELITFLAEQQQSNGSWVNQTPRWAEGDPNLVTAYSLLALSYCDAPLGKTAAK